MFLCITEILLKSKCEIFMRFLNQTIEKEERKKNDFNEQLSFVYTSVVRFDFGFWCRKMCNKVDVDRKREL